MRIPGVCCEEWAIIGMVTIRCISKQLWGKTCNKHCSEAFIQMKWVLFRIAMYWSSGYNLIFCPAILAELWCFEIHQDTRQCVAHARGSQMLQSNVFCPAELLSAGLWFVELSLSCMCVTMSACATRYLVNTVLLCFRDNIGLSAWLNRLKLSLYKHSRVGLEVSMILGDVMGSLNSKSIEQRWSDSGQRLGWRPWV